MMIYIRNLLEMETLFVEVFPDTTFRQLISYAADYWELLDCNYTTRYEGKVFSEEIFVKDTFVRDNDIVDIVPDSNTEVIDVNGKLVYSK